MRELKKGNKRGKHTNFLHVVVVVVLDSFS